MKTGFIRLEPVFHTFMVYLTMMEFPQYRKLDGFKRYYQILDERTFVEVVVMNDTVSRQTVEAKQYPEMIRIKDMLAQEWNFRIMEPEEIELYFGDDKR